VPMEATREQKISHARDQMEWYLHESEVAPEMMEAGKYYNGYREWKEKLEQLEAQ